MYSLALRSLRHRWSGFLATFVAMFFCAGLIMASGGVMQTTFDHSVPPQRLAAAAVVIAGDQNYQLPGEPTPFLLAEQVRVPDAAADAIRGVPGVTAAVPDITFPADVLIDGQPLSQSDQLFRGHGSRVEVATTSYGHGWGSAPLTPFALTAGRAPTGPGDVVLDATTAAAAGIQVGRPVQIQVRGTTQTFQVTGIAAPATPTSEMSIFFSDAQAQQFNPLPGTVDAIGVLTAPGTDQAVLVEQLSSALANTPSPMPLRTLTGDQRGYAEFPDTQRITDLTITAIVFALLALLAGLFGASSTLGLAYQQRQREMALLRAIGTTPRQIRRMIRFESLTVSLLASLVAIVPAWFAGRWLYDQVVASGIAPEGIEFHQGPIVVIVSIVVGLLTAAASTWIAGRRLTATKPTAALSEAETQRTRIGWPRIVFAWIFIALAVVMATATLDVVGPMSASPAALVSILLAIGLGLLGPFVARVLIWLIAPILRLFTGLAGYLGTLNAKAGAARIAAVVTPVTLLVAVATTNLYLVTTEQEVSNANYVGDLQADLVLQSGASGFGPTTLAAVQAQPGVGAASEYVASTGFVESPNDPLAGKDLAGWPLEGVTASSAAQIGVSSITEGDLGQLTGSTVAVPASYAVSLDRTIGDVITLRLGDGAQVDTRIVATFPTNPSFEKLLLPVDLLAQHTPVGAPVRILVRLDEGADPAQVRSGLENLATTVPGATVTDSSSLATAYASHLQSQALVSYMIVAMIAGYTIITIVNNLALSTAQRRKEFGLARLIGATRGQILRMVTFEGVLTALIGLLLGTLLIPTTLVPFGLARSGSPIPAGPVSMYLAVAALAVVVTLVATTLPTWLRLRTRPLDDAIVS